MPLMRHVFGVAVTMLVLAGERARGADVRASGAAELRAAVATAGGFAEYADRGRVLIYRRVGQAMTKHVLSPDEPIRCIVAVCTAPLRGNHVDTTVVSVTEITVTSVLPRAAFKGE